MTAAQTPTGSRLINEVNPDMYSPAERPSSIRAAPAKNRIWSTIGGISSDRVSAIGLPVFSRLGRDELLGPGLDRVGDPQQRQAALGRRGVPPALERVGGGGEGGVDLGLAGDRRGGEGLAGARVDQLGVLVVGEVGPLPADEVAQLIHHEASVRVCLYVAVTVPAGVRSSHAHGEP